MLTQERLRALFDYDPATGELIWRRRPRSDFTSDRSCSTFNAMRPTRIAGNIDCLDGYRKIGIDGRLYRAHRLVWLHVYGEWPSGEIDHINQSKADNRLANLRVVTRVVNARNVPLRKDNTTGFAGVRVSGKTWRAYIGDVCLGRFTTKEAAIAVRRAAERANGYMSAS